MLIIPLFEEGYKLEHISKIMNKIKVKISKEKIRDEVSLGRDPSARPFELERIESQKVYSSCKEGGVIVLHRLTKRDFLLKFLPLDVQVCLSFIISGYF